MSISLNQFLSQLDPYLNQDITELAINKPGEIWLEKKGYWDCAQVDFLTHDWLEGFSNVVANKQQQEITPSKPMLSTTLDNGFRIQIVMPPACAIGTFTITIRKPASQRPTMAHYRSTGFFSRVVPERKGISEVDKRLLDLKSTRQWENLLIEAIRAKKNIIISGATSTGKTTFTNFLISHIPLDERIVTIEDSLELDPPHKNVVRLVYSKGGQGVAEVTPGDELEASLRLTPDRVIYAEIRGAEAFDFLDTIFSGHDGCITSMHASSPLKAIQRLLIMIKKHDVGRTFDAKDIRRMIFTQVDMIVQLRKEPLAAEEQEKGWSTRYISEVYFDPMRQQKIMEEAMQDEDSMSILVSILDEIKTLFASFVNIFVEIKAAASKLLSVFSKKNEGE